MDDDNNIYTEMTVAFDKTLLSENILCSVGKKALLLRNPFSVPPAPTHQLSFASISSSKSIVVCENEWMEKKKETSEM